MCGKSLFMGKTERTAFAIIFSEVISVELTQIGKFLAELRKESGLTQEQLGEKLGVTNKTVSRWETGAYLPPAEALLAISEFFGVSINELLSGKRLSGEAYKEAAEENLKEAVRSGRFSLSERIAFYRRKWLKEHLGIMLLWGLCIAGVFAAGIMLKKPRLLSGAVILLVSAHAWRNNAMMTYVERKAFD